MGGGGGGGGAEATQFDRAVAQQNFVILSSNVAALIFTS